MHPPGDKKNGGVGAITPEHRHNENATATVQALAVTVQAASDASHAIAAPLDMVPAAFASVYAPCASRARWLVVYVCPHCKLGHGGYAHELEKIPGKRRARCGPRVWLIVARRYTAGA